MKGRELLFFIFKLLSINGTFNCVCVYVLFSFTKLKNHLFLNKEETSSKIASKQRRKQNEIFIKSTRVQKKSTIVQIRIRKPIYLSIVLKQ